MIAARSSRVTSRGTTSGAGGGAGASRKAASSASESSRGSRGGPSSGREPARAEASAAAGFPPEDLPAALETAPQGAAGVAEEPVEDESLAQRLLGVRSFLDGDGHDRRARQDGPALDEDELAGHAHEGADVRHLLLVQSGQGLQVGPRQLPEGHLEDVQLALLDEPQQQRQGAVVALQADVCSTVGVGGVRDAYGHLAPTG